MVVFPVVFALTSDFALSNVPINHFFIYVDRIGPVLRSSALITSSFSSRVRKYLKQVTSIKVLIVVGMFVAIGLVFRMPLTISAQENHQLLTGIVHDQKGEGVPFARIFFFCLDGSRTDAITTDAIGGFQTKIRPGSYIIVAVKKEKHISKKWSVGNTKRDHLRLNIDGSNQLSTWLQNSLPIGAIIAVFATMIGFKIRQCRCKRTFNKHIVQSVQEEFDVLDRQVVEYRSDIKNYLYQCAKLIAYLGHLVDKLKDIALSYEERYGLTLMMVNPDALVKLGKCINVTKTLRELLDEIPTTDGITWLTDENSDFSRQLKKLENCISDMAKW